MSNPVVQKIVILAVIFIGFGAALFFLAVPIDCKPNIMIPENPVPPNPNDKPVGIGGPPPAKRPAKTSPEKSAPTKPAASAPEKTPPAGKDASGNEKKDTGANEKKDPGAGEKKPEKN
jgi:hypothetical protein